VNSSPLADGVRRPTGEGHEEAQQERPWPCIVGGLKTGTETFRQAGFLDGRHEQGTSALPERRLHKVFEPPPSPPLQGSEGNVKAVSQSAGASKAQAGAQGANQSDHDAQVDPLSQKAD
jgi:hypothetical protein